MHPCGFDPETSRTVAYNRIANLELPYDTVPHYSIQYWTNNYGNNKKAQKHFFSFPCCSKECSCSKEWVFRII
jgi:hypothetical protein